MLEAGIIVAIFAAIIGCYIFTFSAWRSIVNHFYTKIDEFRMEVTDRLARIETALGIEKDGGG